MPFFGILNKVIGYSRITLDLPVSGPNLQRVYSFLGEWGAVKLWNTGTAAGEVENTWFRVGMSIVLVVVEEYEPVKIIGPVWLIRKVKEHFRKDNNDHDNFYSFMI